MTLVAFGSFPEEDPTAVADLANVCAPGKGKQCGIHSMVLPNGQVMLRGSVACRVDAPGRSISTSNTTGQVLSAGNFGRIKMQFF